jgi:hypothetical protein
MDIWIVTSAAREEDKFGKILAVRVRCYGIFTTQVEADAMAAKHHGHVTPHVTDQESATLLEYWENPGFATRG